MSNQSMMVRVFEGAGGVCGGEEKGENLAKCGNGSQYIHRWRKDQNIFFLNNYTHEHLGYVWYQLLCKNGRE